MPDAVLAFDTSTERLSVGLARGGERWLDERAGGAAASAGLLPAIHALLARAGCSLADLSAVAFGSGPGAFTGLRTSCAVAQGLGFGLRRAVLPIDSLAIVAEQVRQRVAAASQLDVAVAMDARMGEAYAARYRWRDGRWQVVEPPGLWSPSALAAAWCRSPPGFCTGSAFEAFGDPLLGLCPPCVHAMPGDDRAAALLELAVSAWRAGEGVDAALALPLYLRDKVALTTAERTAAGSARAAA